MGWIYLAKNENMPSLVKIGFTERTAKERLKELSSSTGVPGKFFLAGSWQIEKADQAEKILFNELRKYRVDGEFFKLEVQKAKSLIEFLLINNAELNSLYQSNIDKIRASKEAEKVIRDTEIYRKKLEEEAIDDWYFNRAEVIRKCTLESAKLFSKQELFKQLESFVLANKKQSRWDLAGGLTLVATGGMALPAMLLWGGLKKPKPKPKTILDELNKDFRVRFFKARGDVFKWHGIEIPEKIEKDERSQGYSRYALADYCGFTVNPPETLSDALYKL